MDNKATFLDKISIRTVIYSTFGTLFVFLVVIGLASYLGISNQVKNLNTIQTILTPTYQTISGIDDDILKTEILISEFSQTQNPSIMESIESHWDSVNTKINATEENLQTHKQIFFADEQSANEAIEVVQSVRKQFEEVKSFQHEIINEVERQKSADFYLANQQKLKDLENQLFSLLVEKYSGNKNALLSLIDNANSNFKNQVADNAFQMEVLIEGLGVIALIISVLGMIMLTKMILKPLRTITGSIGRVAAGDLNLKIPAQNRSDEIGDIARSMVTIHKKSIEAIKIKTGLDGVFGNIIISDTDGKIMYANTAVRNMLKMRSSDMIAEVSNFDPTNIIGFHLDSLLQHDISNNRQGTKLQKNYGNTIIDYAVTPILNELGDYLGLVVECQDMTDEIMVQKEIDSLVQEAAAGNLTKRLDIANKKGFMLNLGNGINSLLNNISSFFGDLGKAIEALESGDLRYRVSNKYMGQFAEIKDGLNTAFTNIESSMSDIVSAANVVSNVGYQINESSADLAGRTESQASSLEETAASMEELTSTVKQNSENAQEARSIADQNNSIAVQGGKVSKEAIDALNRISHSSDKIAEIIAVIDEIAFQTNLLALNAAVESARAGDAGRGFAVVAEEVRNLAQRSAQASKEITNLINDSLTQVKSGVDLVNKSGDTLSTIMEQASKVADIINEIASASSEQSSGLDQINTAIAQMDETTQRNASLVQESMASASTLSEQTETLNGIISRFKLNQQHLASQASVPSKIKPLQDSQFKSSQKPTANFAAKSSAESFAKSSATSPVRSSASAPAVSLNNPSGEIVKSPSFDAQGKFNNAYKNDKDWAEF